MWYPGRGVSGFLNVWCRDYPEALEHHQSHTGSYLLPYKKQFVVVSTPFIRTLGFTSDSDELWSAIGGNLIEAYAGTQWDTLCRIRIRRMPQD